MKTETLKKSLYSTFVICCFAFGIPLLYYGMTQPDWYDFDVFYGAASAALSGKTIYIIVGKYNLPFWYFPWTAWLYIPFAIFPKNIALILYQLASIICAIWIVHTLLRYYNPSFKLEDKILIFSLLIPMSLEVMNVGQMEYILLWLVMLAIYAIDQDKGWLAGLIFPFIWTKPHLTIIFTLFAFWRSKGKAAITSIAASIMMLIIETIINPQWYLEMFALLKTGQQRTEGLPFTTLPAMLGQQENWLGTANLPITIMLTIIAFLAVWKFRNLPTIPLLSLALAASLFSAQRAYGYDIPLLIPAMIWLTAKDFKSTFWIWVVVAIFPAVTRFASTSYLVTILVFALTLLKAQNYPTNRENLGERNQSYTT